MDKIAVLIPCYNESQTIAKVITDFQRELPTAVIYVYDNNSTDETAEIARNCGAVVRYEYQQGKGNVIRRMFREIEAQCYLMVDGDDTYPAEYAPEMVRKVLENNTDMVVGIVFPPLILQKTNVLSTMLATVWSEKLSITFSKVVFKIL